MSTDNDVLWVLGKKLKFCHNNHASHDYYDKICACSHVNGFHEFNYGPAPKIFDITFE